MPEELAALQREFDALRLSHEELESEITLKLMDRLRDRGLRDGKLMRRARNVSVLGYGHKVLDLPERKGHARSN
jgi:hypothetical protein